VIAWAGMTVEGQRSVGRAFRASVLFVPLALVCYWLWARSGTAPSRFDDELDRALLPVFSQSELQRQVGALTSAQARLLARDLAERSIPYLGARDLELWAATRARVARAQKPACAHLWKGGDEAFLGPAIAELGPEALEAYVQMLARALALRLEEVRMERKPAPRPSPAAIERGFAAIAQQLPADARPRFEEDVQRRDVSDARACELFLTVASGAEKLEPAMRDDFYRALADALVVPRGTPGSALP
jgi:hypothetical protein